MKTGRKKENPRAYLIGAGIASLSAAAYLIRDGKFDGKDIFIFEESGDTGGSLDAKTGPEKGYIVRGQRMLTREVYNCTLDLFSFVPLSKNSKKTLLDDFNEFNGAPKNRWEAKSRLVEKGKIADFSDFGISAIDELNIVKMYSLPESSLDGLKISDLFSPAFFETNFWTMWCTTFAFEPWHSAIELRRYALRFIQNFPCIRSMSCVENTRYNQYESIILPLTDWLKDKGVNFLMRNRVVALKFISAGAGKERVGRITVSENGSQREIAVSEEDLVFFTNGSMTTNSTFGTMQAAPVTSTDEPQDSWAVWKDIAKGRPAFGRPEVFSGHINKSKWESFSVTFRDRTFSDLMKKFSKNRPGTGGITTIKDSAWLISIITPHQPHFADQPEDMNVLWGYALFPDKKGDFVKKKMTGCTGEEILTELCAHLGFSGSLEKIIRSADCVPCVMPYITSQFLPRKKTDRPAVIPEGTANFAFIGQFCEIPDEVVFTVEQSVRSAMLAVYGLLGLKKKVPPIYQGWRDPAVAKSLLKAGIGFEMEKIMPGGEVRIGKRKIKIFKK